MPYEEEKSSLTASANFNKFLQNSFNYKINTLDYKEKIVNALIKNKEFIGNNISLNKNNVAKNILCIDGSILEQQIDNLDYCSAIALQVGYVFIDSQNLFNLQKDNKNNYNPLDIADLFSHKNNIIINQLFPGQNFYLENDNGKVLNLKKSFIFSLQKMINDKNFKNMITNFETLLNKPSIFNTYEYNIIQSLLTPETTDLTLINNINNKGVSYEKYFSRTKLFNNFHKDINDDFNYNTKKDITNLMLTLENLLAFDLINNTNNLSNTNQIIILDGRLDNMFLSQLFNIYFDKRNIINENNILISVQKTGLLNNITTKIQTIFEENYFINNKDKSVVLTNINMEYFYNNKPILIKVTENFRKDLGLPGFSKNSYGQEYLYISQKKEEFIFSLVNNNCDEKILNKILQNICSLLEYTSTNLYVKNKGVLLSNIIAHNNVALNNRYTNLSEINKNNNNAVNQNYSKPKI